MQKTSLFKTYVTPLKQQKSLCLTPWCEKVQMCPYKYELMCWSYSQLELIFPSMQHCKYWRFAGSQLDNEHVYSPNGSKKKTMRKTDRQTMLTAPLVRASLVMGSNTVIFAVLKAWLMSPLHCFKLRSFFCPTRSELHPDPTQLNSLVTSFVTVTCPISYPPFATVRRWPTSGLPSPRSTAHHGCTWASVHDFVLSLPSTARVAG